MQSDGEINREHHNVILFSHFDMGELIGKYRAILEKKDGKFMLRRIAKQ